MGKAQGKRGVGDKGHPLPRPLQLVLPVSGEEMGRRAEPPPSATASAPPYRLI